MLRALLVDDEQPARERLRRLLAEVPDVEIVGEAEDGEDAMDEIARSRPTWSFSTSRCRGAPGWKSRRRLRSPRPHIVFCTAFDEFAVDAFELSAVDYLLKPVNRARLAKALERVRGTAGEADGAIEKAALAGAPPTRFLARRGSTFSVVPASDVLCFLSEGGLTKLHGERSALLDVADAERSRGAARPAAFLPDLARGDRQPRRRARSGARPWWTGRGRAVGRRATRSQPAAIRRPDDASRERDL